MAPNFVDTIAIHNSGLLNAAQHESTRATADSRWGSDITSSG